MPPPPISAEKLVAGDRATLARAITQAEGTRPHQRTATRKLLAQLQPVLLERSAASFRLGITGSPGAGKSTFIEAYGSGLIRDGHRLAVLAVDPSSSRTRGSILGDKTRMATLALSADAYVRPSPAGATLGGVAAATYDSIALCEAAGYDRIIIETVGVGQSEHAVHSMCDCMVLLVLPGSGDDLQGIKRGIVELADLVVVNKADGERVRAARDTAGDYRRALHLQPARADGWSPAALVASSVAKDGLLGFGESLTSFVETLGRPGRTARRQEQALAWFERSWQTGLLADLASSPAFKELLQQQRLAITAGTLPAVAAAQLLTLLNRALARL